MFCLVHIYFCDMNNFEHLLEECLSSLPKNRRRKAERLYSENSKLLSATAGLMMKKVLGVTEDWMVLKGKHGKPYIEHGPFFSISHSIRYSVLAVSENEIGIDIEMHENPPERIFERCFSEEEQVFAKQSTENFQRLWSAKEAVLKFLGTGFSYSPKNFSVLPLSAEHEICGKRIRLFCSDINGAVLTAAFCGEEEFEFTEFFPKDLIY